MSKIKVTFVETNCKKNGPIKQTLNIIRNMDKEVFEPSLVTVWPEDADNSMIDEYKKLGIPVLSANMSKKKSVLFGKKEVGQLLEQLQPDIVQGVGMPPYRMTLGYKRAIHFVTLRNYCYEDYPDYYGKIPGTVMAFLDLNLIKKRMAAGEPFVTCSESLTKMYRSRQNMEIPYIRNGVDVSQYTKRNCDEIDDVRRKLDLPLGKVIYVYSGGFIDRKNQREAITAFLAMKKNADAVLLLLGDGTNFEALKDEFSKNTNILFRGKVSNVNEYLHASDVYLATSKSEGLPNGVLEAMACGLPVLLSDIPQHMEVLEADPQCGHSYKLGNAKQLSALMDQMMDENLFEMGERSYTAVMENFTAEGMSKRYQNLYLKLMNRLYQSFTGKFDENYFPEYLFSSVLEPKMNPMDYRYVLDDKLLLPLFCVGVDHVRTPRTYYSVCDGICFDEEKNIVDLKNDNFNGGGYRGNNKTCSRYIIRCWC